MLIILIFNLAPFLNDDLFDGFVLRLVHHYKFKEQYHKILLEENALITGRGELLFFEDVDYSNPLISRASIYNYYYLLLFFYKIFLLYKILHQLFHNYHSLI